MEAEITGHRLHPSCTLVLKADGDAFDCGACKRGSSHAYRYSCEHLDLHGQCVTSSDSFSFWGHPHHPLELVSSGPDLAATLRSTRPEIAEILVASSPAADGRIPVYCDICTNEIQGMHYRCAPCGVFLHPVCVQLPVTVRSVAHPEHELTLISTWPSMCMACGTPSTWAYRCFRCLVRFHVNCVPEYHHWLSEPYSGGVDPNGVPDRTRRFGLILPPKPPPPPKMFVDKGDAFAGMNPLGLMDPFNMPRRGPSTTPSVRPDPCGGAFPYSGEYGRSTFGQ